MADFSYLGAFAVPLDYSLALTVWRPGGVMRLLAQGAPQQTHQVVDLTIPPDTSLVRVRPFYESTIVRTFGAHQLYGNPRFGFTTEQQYPTTYQTTSISDAGYGQNMALCWDETSSRLYWIRGSNYSATPHDASVGYLPINSSDGSVGTAQGIWHFAQGSTVIGWKKVNTGILHLPSTFTSQYLNAGERMAIGMGGYQSLEAQGGGISMGPCLFALNPTLFDTTPASSLTWLTGSTAAHTNGANSTVVTLKGSPNLASISTTGFDTLYVDVDGNGTSTRYQINGKDNVAKTVSIAGSGVNIALGSARDYQISIRPCDSNGLLQSSRAVALGATLINYGYNTAEVSYPNGSTGPFPMRRDTNYTSTLSGAWDPQSTIGFSQWFDRSEQQMVYVDGVNKHGVIMVANSGERHHWYGVDSTLGGQPSAGHCQDAKIVLRVYDPADLGRVVTGALRPDEPNASTVLDYRNSTMMAAIYVEEYGSTTQKPLTWPIPGATDGGEIPQRVTGAWHDPASSRIFILQQQALNNGAPNNRSLVHVISVQAST